MRCLLPLLGLALSAPLTAQGFNVDIGQNLIFWPTPDSAYAAAGGQSGHWNDFDPGQLSLSLEDLAGTPTAVTLTTNKSSSVNTFPHVMASGDDQALMEDYQWSSGVGAVIELRFEGLMPGDYEVYTYAASPASSADITRVTVIGSPDVPTDVQGPWPGQHTEGGSFARHSVTTLDGVIELRLEAQNPAPDDRAACNGIQLVPDGGSVGTTYCSPAELNSTGAFGTILALGSDVVADNDFDLLAQALPTGQFGYFIASQTQGFIPNPGGSQGNLCLGGTLVRFTAQLQNSGGAGSFQIPVDLSSMPTSPPSSVLPGQTWNFQAWYRDLNPQATSNFTDGVSVVYQ